MCLSEKSKFPFISSQKKKKTGSMSYLKTPDSEPFMDRLKTLGRDALLHCFVLLRRVGIRFTG